MCILKFKFRFCGADGSHDDLSCDAGEIVIVNYAATEHTWKWQCGADDGRCPGAFQVGCEDPDNGASSTFSVGAIIMAIAVFIA